MSAYPNNFIVYARVRRKWPSVVSIVLGHFCLDILNIHVIVRDSRDVEKMSVALFRKKTCLESMSNLVLKSELQKTTRHVSQHFIDHSRIVRGMSPWRVGVVADDAYAYYDKCIGMFTIELYY